MPQRQTQGSPAQGQRTNASGRVGGRNRLTSVPATGSGNVGSAAPSNDPPASTQAQTTAGRRAQSRAAQAQARAAQQRRRLLLVGGGSAVLVVAIIGVVLLLTHPWQSNGMTNLNALSTDKATMDRNYSAVSKIGTTAPDFTLSTLDGHQYTLSSLRGHPVVVEFFAVWCPHCQAMAPRINNVEKQYATKGLQVLSILANPYDRFQETTQQYNPANADDITWFKNTYNVKHPILIDPSFSVTNQYGAGSYPTMLVLDRNGVVRYSNQGDFTQKTLADAVAKAS